MRTRTRKHSLARKNPCMPEVKRAPGKPSNACRTPSPAPPRPAPHRAVPQVVVVSMGPRGCVARTRAGEAGRSGAPDVRVVDTIGAGDAFTAGYLFAHLRVCGLGVCDPAAACAVVQPQPAQRSAFCLPKPTSRLQTRQPQCYTNARAHALCAGRQCAGLLRGRVCGRRHAGAA
jgi:hypothetical protein